MRVLIVLSVLSACYQPTVANCQYTCGAGDACPDGQSCTSGFCVTPGEVCTTGSGSGILGGVPDVPSGLSPANGVYTGSYLFAGSLTPTFRWAAAAGADTYDLDLDPTCITPATCAFPDGQTIHATAITTTSYTPASLAVSMMPPVGRRYGWRMRACNSTGCSGWTAARYLNVGRLRDDIDGDGKSELVIGSSMTVNLPIYRVDGSGSATLFTTCAPSNGENVFGVAIVVGDFNGDGFSDLAVSGIVGTTDDVTVISGATSPNCPDGEARLAVGSGATAFGTQLAGIGDIDGDGYDDLVATEVTAAGLGLDVYFGSENGLDSAHPVAIALPMPSLSFSSALVRGIGDIDGDGYLDAAFAIGSNPASAALAIVPGSSARTFAVTQMLTEPATSEFPLQIAIVDIDGDGLADLFATAQTDDQDPTTFVVGYHASSTGLTELQQHFTSVPIDANFGDALLPITDGGAAELAISDESNPVTIVDASFTATASNIADPGNPDDDDFGAALGGGDVGTGSTWLAVGAPNAGGDKVGAVFFCPRTGSDAKTGFATCTELVDPNSVHNDAFGQTLSP